jgi:hypothetical protein
MRLILTVTNTITKIKEFSMKKKINILMALAVFGTMSAFAIDVNGSAPTFTGQGPIYGPVADELNIQVENAFNRALYELRGMVGGIDPKPKKFMLAWGNSAIYASHGATQRGYGGYNVFAVTIGPMVGFQIPSSPFALLGELDGLEKKLNEEHDISLGINPQIISAQIGINASKFLLKNLYLGLRIGYMRLGNSLIDGFSFSNLTLGLLANYQLLPHIKLPTGLLQWRGINLGSGFIYQGTNIGYNLKLDTITQPIGTIALPLGYGTLNPNLLLDPELVLDMKIGTYTIPLEATTSVKLLYFLNFAFGLGADLGFGKNKLNIGLGSNINVNGLESVRDIQQARPGNLIADAGGNMTPSVFNLRLMTGIGFSFGPVILDIPVTWYFTNKGYNIGLTLGVVL